MRGGGVIKGRVDSVQFGMVRVQGPVLGATCSSFYPSVPLAPPWMQFGKVYKGLWQGQEVAVKSMVLPLAMLGTEKRECMAVMEAAISSSLRHPNIVQV